MSKKSRPEPGSRPPRLPFAPAPARNPDPDGPGPLFLVDTAIENGRYVDRVGFVVPGRAANRPPSSDRDSDSDSPRPAPSPEIPSEPPRFALALDPAAEPIPADPRPPDSPSSTAILVPRLFVYGTLRPGEPLFPLLERLGFRARTPADLPGTLLDLGSYPGLVPTRSPEDRVRGEIVELRDPARALPALDEVEGFPGHHHPRPLYRRVLALVPLPDDPRSPNPVLVWLYRLVHHPRARTAPTIPGGDWKRR